MPKDDSSAQTPTAAASFRTVFDALKAALGWVGTNEDALRDLITLVTDLPAPVQSPKNFFTQNPHLMPPCAIRTQVVIRAVRAE